MIKNLNQVLLFSQEPIFPVSPVLDHQEEMHSFRVLHPHILWTKRLVPTVYACIILLNFTQIYNAHLQVVGF